MHDVRGRGKGVGVVKDRWMLAPVYGNARRETDGGDTGGGGGGAGRSLPESTHAPDVFVSSCFY